MQQYQVGFYKLFQNKLTRKKAQMVSEGNNKEYTVRAHMKWVDRESFGILHFSIHPEKLWQENILFDVFHICRSIKRRIMEYWNFSLWYKRNRLWINKHKWWNYFGLISILKCVISTSNLLHLKAWIYLPSSHIFQTWFTLSRRNLQLPSL